MIRSMQICNHTLAIPGGYTSLHEHAANAAINAFLIGQKWHITKPGIPDRVG